MWFCVSEVHEGWVTSLLASRGQPSPTPPELHGQFTMKDTRSRCYAAVWGHDLWIYPNKEGFQLGIASFSVPLNVATVKPLGKHSFTLITPFKTFRYYLCFSVLLSVVVCLQTDIVLKFVFSSLLKFFPPLSFFLPIFLLDNPSPWTQLVC